MSKSRPNIPDELNNITTSCMEALIEQANLGIEDTRIAKMYLIDKIPQVEIAEEVEVTRSTVSTRCKSIVKKIASTMDIRNTDCEKDYSQNGKIIYLNGNKAG